jgi:hypothetical protein
VHLRGRRGQIEKEHVNENVWKRIEGSLKTDHPGSPDAENCVRMGSEFCVVNAKGIIQNEGVDVTGHSLPTGVPFPFVIFRYF